MKKEGEGEKSHDRPFYSFRALKSEDRLILGSSEHCTKDVEATK